RVHRAIRRPGPRGPTACAAAAAGRVVRDHRPVRSVLRRGHPWHSPPCDSPGGGVGRPASMRWGANDTDNLPAAVVQWIRYLKPPFLSALTLIVAIASPSAILASTEEAISGNRVPL